MSLADLLPTRTNPSNSDDKLIQIKMSDLSHIVPNPDKKRSHLLIEVEMN